MLYIYIYIYIYIVFKTILYSNNYFNIFFYSRGVSGPAYAHHDYSPRPTGHVVGAGKAPRG